MNTLQLVKKWLYSKGYRSKCHYYIDPTTKGHSLKVVVDLSIGDRDFLISIADKTTNRGFHYSRYHFYTNSPLKLSENQLQALQNILVTSK